MQEIRDSALNIHSCNLKKRAAAVRMAVSEHSSTTKLPNLPRNLLFSEIFMTTSQLLFPQIAGHCILADKAER